MSLAQLDRPATPVRHTRHPVAPRPTVAHPAPHSAGEPARRGTASARSIAATPRQQATAAAISGSISAAPPLVPQRAHPSAGQPRQAGAAGQAGQAGRASAARVEGASDAGQRIRAVPAGTRARGFVVYVGLDEDKAARDGISLGELVAALKRLTGDLAPSAETYAAVALAPESAGGRDVDVVRLALQDPAALADHRRREETPEEEPGVVIDITRKRLSVDGENAGLTYKEFELLQYLVLREGQTIERAALIDGLWSADSEEEAPNERTIDVHVRRLRAKLGVYEDIVRTVRGAGYRFDRHADVSIHYASAPSPDFF